MDFDTILGTFDCTKTSLQDGCISKLHVWFILRDKISCELRYALQNRDLENQAFKLITRCNRRANLAGKCGTACLIRRFLALISLSGFCLQVSFHKGFSAQITNQIWVDLLKEYSQKILKQKGQVWDMLLRVVALSDPVAVTCPCTSGCAICFSWFLHRFWKAQSYPKIHKK